MHRFRGRFHQKVTTTLRNPRPRSGLRCRRAGKISGGKGPHGGSERGEEMFASIADGLLDGFLSGLEVQGEINDLLERLYYDGLM
jgi:hypothetical protein